MMISIDTADSLNDLDRAVLRALMGDRAPAGGPHPTPRSSSAEAVQEQILNGAASRNGARSTAKLPVTQQPGVTATESTREDSQQTD